MFKLGRSPTASTAARSNNILAGIFILSIHAICLFNREQASSLRAQRLHRVYP